MLSAHSVRLFSDKETAATAASNESSENTTTSPTTTMVNPKIEGMSEPASQGDQPVENVTEPTLNNPFSTTEEAPLDSAGTEGTFPGSPNSNKSKEGDHWGKQRP